MRGESFCYSRYGNVECARDLDSPCGKHTTGLACLSSQRSVAIDLHKSRKAKQNESLRYVQR